MYQFKIKKQEDGGYRFELDGIRMIVDDYSVRNDQHILTHPNKAIAYFMVNENIYGVSNDPLNYDTAEAFYDAITRQYQIFKSDSRPDMNVVQHTA